MRIYVAGMITETNTYSPRPTGRMAFEEYGLGRAHAKASPPGAETSMMAKLWNDLAERDGHAFEEGIFAHAQPAGRTVQAVYEDYRDQILADVEARGPFDAVLLFLHGAMVATGCDDCEGELIGLVRERVGPKASIGALLDPHCHLTERMVEQATAIILAKEYPHTDYAERGTELYDICLAAAQGRCAPTPALFDCRMVGWYPTTIEPMRGLVARMRAAEALEGVLSVSFAHGFPWGDTPETGSRVLAIADGDVRLAARIAMQVGLDIYRARELLLPRFPGIEEALDAAAKCPGRTVLADTADNPGGGAPGDSVALLQAMLRRKIDAAAFGAVWDPMAARVCAEAGVGARLALRLGGKCGPASGDPLDALATVRAVKPEHEQGGLGPTRVAMGLSAWIEVEGAHGGRVDVVVNSQRTQVFTPDAFSGLGIDLEARKLVAVKSSWHFQAGFAPLAERLLPVATPGAIQMDFAAIEYRRKRDLDFFPRIPDPLGLDA